MKNLLIIEDDLIQSYLLINSICRNISDIRLYNIVSTGKEAIKIITENKVDIIILKLNLVDMEGIEIINFIKNNKMTKYIGSIFVITNDIKLLSQVIDNEYVFGYGSLISSGEFIIKQIKEMMSKKEKLINYKSLENRIKTELEKLGFQFSYIGTRYMYECIYMCYYKQDIYKINLSKDIYPSISAKYFRTINSIKTSIFQVIDLAYRSIDKSILSEYLGYNVITRPSTKEILNSILEKIKEK